MVSKKELLRQITILDFVATDLGLFLDTHPKDAEAICKYNETVQAAEACRKEYNEHYGPLTGWRCKNPSSCWEWDKNPWPWQVHYNFDLKGCISGKDLSMMAGGDDYVGI